MRRSVALAGLLAVAVAQGGCITQALLKPYQGPPESKACFSEAEVSAVSWSGARPRGSRVPVCILFLKGVRPGAGSERGAFWESLASPSSALVIEADPGDLMGADHDPGYFGMAGAETRLEGLLAQVRFTGKPGEGIPSCEGTVTVRVPGHEATFPVRSVRPASREETDGAVPLEGGAEEPSRVRFLEERVIPPPAAPWYVVAVAPVAVAGDVALVATFVGLVIVVAVSPILIAAL